MIISWPGFKTLYSISSVTSVAKEGTQHLPRQVRPRRRCSGNIHSIAASLRGLSTCFQTGDRAEGSGHCPSCERRGWVSSPLGLTLSQVPAKTREVPKGWAATSFLQDLPWFRVPLPLLLTLFFSSQSIPFLCIRVSFVREIVFSLV